ncbi:MAG: TlpA family protein disulfide reductase [Chloroflexi bacterium]|nr:TlpA family protein disulfide reductase [Chloroflexota bacterium]
MTADRRGSTIQTHKHSRKIVESKQNTARKRQALIVMAVGLLVGLAAIYLSLNQDAPASIEVNAEAGAFPVASLFGVNNAQTQPDAGYRAPDFAMHQADGETIYLSDYQGRPVIINFWATWCPPCRAEMPELVRVYNEYKDDGLVIIAVDSMESQEAVAEFVKAFRMNMPVVIDAQGQVMSAYKTQSLPSSFFIDRNGVVQVRWIGILTPEILQQNLEAIL